MKVHIVALATAFAVLASTAYGQQAPEEHLRGATKAQQVSADDLSKVLDLEGKVCPYLVYDIIVDS